MNRKWLVAAGVTVAVAVAAGGGYVWWRQSTTTAVPNEFGKAPSEAAALIKSNELSTGRVTRDPDAERSEWGTVIAQSPNPGERLKKRTAVTVVVGGPESVSVPAIVDVTVEEAKARLTTAGLKVGSVKKRMVDGMQAMAGLVASQDPPAKASAKYLSAVDIVVYERWPLENQLLGEWRRTDTRDDYPQSLSWTFLPDHTFINGLGESHMWSVKNGTIMELLPSSAGYSRTQAMKLQRKGKTLLVWDPPTSKKPTRRYEFVKSMGQFPPPTSLPPLGTGD